MGRPYLDNVLRGVAGWGLDSSSDGTRRPPSLRGANGSRECAPDDRLREAIHPFVIPGRAKHEPGIHRSAKLVDQWIPGLRQVAHPGMTKKHIFAFSRRIAPEVCWKLFALGSQRAQGMPDARCTRDLMRNVHRKCAHEHTGQRRTSDIPCAMALRLITCSPRRTALLPPLRPEKLLPPGALTPAPRRQDHTSSPYA